MPVQACLYNVFLEAMVNDHALQLVSDTGFLGAAEWAPKMFREGIAMAVQHNTDSWRC